MTAVPRRLPASVPETEERSGCSTGSTTTFIAPGDIHETMTTGPETTGERAGTPRSAPRMRTSDPTAAEGSLAVSFGTAPPPPPAAVERAVSLVERRACESPDAVSGLVDVAETECGWWLLSELATAGSDLGPVETADRRGDGAGIAPRSPLVESLARFTRRSTEDVFKTLHTRLLPKLLVTDVVEHAGSVAAPPNYDATVELRSDADREFVSAVLFLVAVEAELADETRELSAAIRSAVERFSEVVRRIRTSSRRASGPSVGTGTPS